MLTIEDVTHIAELARLQLTDAETEIFRDQISDVLDYIDLISSLDLTDIDPTHSVIAQQNTLRADEVHESLTREELLRNAPETEAGSYQVPAVQDEG